MIKRHTVLLGAGATMAAIPNGDKNGKKSSVMNNLFSELGMNYILKNVHLHTSSKTSKIFIQSLLQGQSTKMSSK